MEKKNEEIEKPEPFFDIGEEVYFVGIRFIHKGIITMFDTHLQQYVVRAIGEEYCGSDYTLDNNELFKSMCDAVNYLLSKKKR